MPRFQIALVLLCVGVVACNSIPPPRYETGYVTHIVVCWLKSPGNEEAIRELIEVSKGFRDIPGVVEISTGKVLPSDRPMVVSDFDVAIVMTFENQKAMEAYLRHPDHQEAVTNTLQPLAQKILVYDFIVE